MRDCGRACVCACLYLFKLIVFPVCPSMPEMTALGAAMAAGYAEGIDVWDLKNVTPISASIYEPSRIVRGMRDVFSCAYILTSQIGPHVIARV